MKTTLWRAAVRGFSMSNLARLARGLAFVMLAGMMSVAHAVGNFSFLLDTPMSRLSPDELTSLTDTVNRVRDTSDDWQVTNWKSNEGTPVEARITPFTSSRGNVLCRQVTVEIRSKGQLMVVVPFYCKNAQNEWEFRKMDF